MYILMYAYSIVNSALSTRLKSFVTVVWVAQHWALGFRDKKVVVYAAFPFAVVAELNAPVAFHGVNAIVAWHP